MIAIILQLLFHHKLEELTLGYLDLGPEASVKLARAVFTMTNLRLLKLENLTLDDSFFHVFSVMSDVASQSQVKFTAPLRKEKRTEDMILREVFF